MMCSLKMIFVWCVGLTICCQIRSTSGNSTSIKMLTERIKTFFIKVKKLDRTLKLPEAMKDLNKIRYKAGIWSSIRSNEKYLDQFREEYIKLAISSSNVVKDYETQFNEILPTRLVGNQSKRIQLCKYYDKKITNKLDIKGEGAKDAKIKEMQADLKNNLDNLHFKIFIMKRKYEYTQEKKSTGCGFSGCMPISLPNLSFDFTVPVI